MVGGLPGCWQRPTLLQSFAHLLRVFSVCHLFFCPASSITPVRLLCAQPGCAAVEAA